MASNSRLLNVSNIWLALYATKKCMLRLPEALPSVNKSGSMTCTARSNVPTVDSINGRGHSHDATCRKPGNEEGLFS